MLISLKLALVSKSVGLFINCCSRLYPFENFGGSSIFFFCIQSSWEYSYCTLHSKNLPKFIWSFPYLKDNGFKLRVLDTTFLAGMKNIN